MADEAAAPFRSPFVGGRRSGIQYHESFRTMQMDDEFVDKVRMITVRREDTGACFQVPVRGLCRTEGGNDLMEQLVADPSGPATQRLVSPLCPCVYQGDICEFGTRCRAIHIAPRAWDTRRETASGSSEKEPVGHHTIVKAAQRGAGSGGGGGGGLLKTKLCHQFQEAGRCAKGRECTYAHGQAELRAPGGAGGAPEGTGAMKRAAGGRQEVVDAKRQRAAAIDAAARQRLSVGLTAPAASPNAAAAGLAAALQANAQALLLGHGGGLPGNLMQQLAGLQALAQLRASLLARQQPQLTALGGMGLPQAMGGPGPVGFPGPLMAAPSPPLQDSSPASESVGAPTPQWSTPAAAPGAASLPPLPSIKPVPGPQRQHVGRYRSREFTFCSHHDGNGIIFFMGLKDQKWTNPVSTRKLRVIASSLASGNLAMTVDQEFNAVLYSSRDEFPAWVVFDFLECSVRPTYYTLAHKGLLPAYMRSWRFEGSHDADRWDLLCVHTNDDSLQEGSSVASWPVQAASPYRYLRLLLQRGGNAKGTSALVFNAFEVYGEFCIPTL